MDVVLVGADFEENLGMGMIAAAAQQAGHAVTVMPYNHSSECERLAECIARAAPDVLGISAQFQHRAADFLGLAAALRDQGFAGHITMGGQFPTLAFPEVLADESGVDSVVLYDGEQTFVELLAALRDKTPLRAVPGLALRDDAGVPVRTATRSWSV